MTESIRLFRGPFGHVSLLNVGGNLVTHAHPEAHIVIWLSGAPGLMTVGCRSLVPERGVAIGVNSFEPHNHQFAEGEVPGQFLAFYIDMDWLRARRGLPAGADAFHAPRIPLDSWIAGNAGSLTSRLMSIDEDYDLIAYELERFIDHVLDTADAARPKNRTLACSRGGRDYRIRKAIALMEANVGERICFDQVARSVGLSRPHFFALFKDQMSVTPNVYWNTLRIAEAVRCLQSTDDSLISVACNLGFSTQGNFSRFFREHTGVPPTVYRSAANEGLRPPTDDGGGQFAAGYCR